jgi:hypothetical protein
LLLLKWSSQICQHHLFCCNVSCSSAFTHIIFKCLCILIVFRNYDTHDRNSKKDDSDETHNEGSHEPGKCANLQILPDNHSRLGAFVDIWPPFCFHVFIVMSLGTLPGTPASIFDRLKEFVSSIHALKLSICYHTPRFILLCICFHVFKYFLSL